MKRMLVTVQYDGTAYHGWQTQPNGITVQETIEQSLLKLLKTKTVIHGCSRTDAGVHAKGFCFHLDCEDNIPETAFLRGLNSLLPDDIAVIDCRQTDSNFHARYDAKGKTYTYKILNSSRKDAFLSRYSWRIERTLNIEKMNEFCQKIIGTHDFSPFSSSGRTVEDTIRTITECKVEKQGDIVTLLVTGNGFLYNMVRIIVGTAVEVSDGKINPCDIEDIFISQKRELLGVTAPPQALFLEKVYY